ncbi:uncharacterized protein BDZ99DRAFT_214969 [Mytilinidion resinicola]|uniref:Uncharacterized protein n=1 Tax=Mytilinidion resinicola TaxID=574789 RepID=A0A6A6Y091_9PEZI|nr:uncharacterized protein BDZ99DRAFT_214969 [Mytilinidion resinicola]KAF2801635.1 hypothetical protein BDZ99DRAFT_214969 [Mytilinidion resinicola]
MPILCCPCVCSLPQLLPALRSLGNLVFPFSARWSSLSALSSPFSVLRTISHHLAPISPLYHSPLARRSIASQTNISQSPLGRSEHVCATEESV